MTPVARGPRRRGVRLGFFAVAVVGTLFGLFSLWLHLITDPLIDFHAYYDAAARLNAGTTLYLPESNPFYPDFYRYPPLLAIVLRPLALLPYDLAALVWGALLVAATVLTLFVLGARRPQTWLALGVLGLPIGWAVSVGQAQVLVTLLLAFGAPWSVALAAQLKVLPALVALYWVGRRDWRSLGRFALFTAGLIAVQFALAPADAGAFASVFSLDEVGIVRNLSPYAIAPPLWFALVGAGAIATLLLARTRWGWAAAVSLSVLASPRLLAYMLSSMWASVRGSDGGQGPVR